MQELIDTNIFLSYTRNDEERVTPIYEYLVKNGYPNVWMDIKKLLPGQPWDYEIQRNLDKAEIVIIFLSHSSVNKRGYVQKELKASLRILEEKLSDDIYIIPVKLDSDVIIPTELLKIQYLDFNDSNASNLLLKALEYQVERLGKQSLKPIGNINEIQFFRKTYKEFWEGLPGYDVEYSIPILHSAKIENINEITKIIEADYIEQIQQHREQKLEQLTGVFSWAQEPFMRTNTYDAHYNISCVNNLLSIQYTVHWYGAGAAHPNYHFEIYNFLLNPLIRIKALKDIFTQPDDAFFIVVQNVRSQLLNIPNETDEDGNPIGTEKLLDKEWINSGTDSWEKLDDFTFSENGLEFYFAPYQVGAYACGAQFASIPYNIIGKYLKWDILNALGITYTI